VSKNEPLLTSLDDPPDPRVGSAGPSVGAVLPGPLGVAWVDRLARHECPAITARRSRRAEDHGIDQDPIVWAKAVGANVWDPDGNRYVDLTGGFGVCSAGHGHPAVRAAVHAQVDALVHGLGDAFPSTTRIELAEALARLLPGDLSQAIFASSGSEAVEAALKTAAMATGRSRVVAFEGGYHGMGLGVLAASHYRESFRAPFAGLLGGYSSFLPWGCDEGALTAALDGAAALLLEPVQGRGGDREPPPGWLPMLRRVCDAAGALLIYDEIFTGFGRTGTRFVAGSEPGEGVVPDLICLGKGLTSGFPLSACVGTPGAMAGWGHSRGEALHTSTFLGHPVGCAAGLAVVDLIENHGLVERGAALGEHMAATLSALVDADSRFVGVRGRGAMRGLEVAAGVSAFGLCRALLSQGYLVLPAGLQGEVISFTPPLTTTATQWDGAVAALAAS